MKKTQTHDIDLQRVETLAHWMDSRFQIPGTSIRFGLDSLLGLIPGIGDTATLLATAYLIGKAGRYSLPLSLKFRMGWNAFLDWLIGLIPLIGDIFDIGWKANLRNVALLKNHLEEEAKKNRLP